MQLRHLLRSLFLIGSLTVLPVSSAHAETSVRLTFRGPGREPVSITSAQLFVTAWGVSQKHDLPVEGSVVRLDLEAARPDFADLIADTSGFIYVKAAGYAPIMSEAFRWPTRETPAVVDFRNGRRITIAPGTTAALDVTLRRPLPRSVRLIDVQGRAVSGASVEAAAYWSTPGHCGFMNGRDLLAAGSTHRDGTMAVPDLDGPYVFSLLEQDMLFADAKNYYPAGLDRQGLVKTLDRPDTTLRVRRYQTQRLVLDVVSNGKPLPGAVLWADMGLGVCGAGYGPLATADAQGRIRQDGFIPELWRSYWICDGRKQAWVLPFGAKLPRRIDIGVTPGRDPNGFADLCGR